MPLGGLLTTTALTAGAGYLNKRMNDKAAAGGPGLSPTNPSFGTLNRLFGTKLVKHKHGADKGTTSLVRDKNNPGLFGAQFDESLRNFAFNPPPIYGGETGIVNSLLSGGGAQRALDTGLSGFDSLIGRTNSFLDTAGQTGYQVDASPLYEIARNQFSRNVLPEIAERLGSTSGIRSQGFIDTAGREGANLLDSAAAANVQLADSAAQRRLAANQFGIPALGTLLGARTALPFSVASDTLNLGTQYRNILDQQASRPLSVFSQLAGLGTPGNQGFFLQGYNPQGSGTANLLGSLAAAVPSLLGGFGGAGGGAGTPPFFPNF